MVEDDKFKEFIEVHKPKSSKPFWGNDTTGVDKEEAEDTDSGNSEEDVDKSCFKSHLSDIEYLKSKTVKDNESQAEIEEDSKIRQHNSEYTVKLRNLPYKCNKKLIKDFFRPLKIRSLRRPPKIKGIAYVQFDNENNFKLALKMHKGFIGSHRIEVVNYKTSEENQQGVKSEDSKYDKYQKMSEDLEKNSESIAESGSIFFRNLSYTVKEDDLETLFSKFGPLAEINVPIDSFSKKIKGFGTVTFMLPEHASKAYSELDGSVFQGRILHLLSAKSKEQPITNTEDMTYKNKKAAETKANSSSSHNWNTLFLGSNAVADVISQKFDVSKKELLNSESSESIAVRMALGETQIVVETRNFLMANGVSLDSFSQPSSPRSKNVILVKNLPSDTAVEEMRVLFEKHGKVERLILPPSGITAVVEFQEPFEAKNAFRRLAYTKFKHVPLYLEWAPMKIFNDEINNDKTANYVNKESENEGKVDSKSQNIDEEEDEENDYEEPDSTLFVKNLNFQTTEDDLKKHFNKYGPMRSVTIAKKKDFQGNVLSMGYGFVQFKTKQNAQKALKELQHSTLDDHSLELKVSNRVLKQEAKSSRKLTKEKSQTSSKILVRNIPFEATKRELYKLFGTFGELKALRLPMKNASASGSHRGFAFVDYLTKQDAKSAFNALCHSTHLFGRRLVLEWADDDESVATLRKKTSEHFYAGEGSLPVKKFKKATADLLTKADEDEDEDA